MGPMGHDRHDRQQHGNERRENTDPLSVRIAGFMLSVDFKFSHGFEPPGETLVSGFLF
jgi:hypothetical protein